MVRRETLVVKVGTSTLLSQSEQPSATFEYVAQSIQKLSATYDIVLVTSGAIGFGVTQLGLDARPVELHDLQALSMIGQVGLLRRWREAFDGTTIGQVLVTRRDLEVSKTTTLFRESVHSLWAYGAVPVINENDAVSTEEISFGDNDRLAAEVAVALNASKLILLTDQDGIRSDFGTDREARIVVARLRDAETHIQPTKSSLGKGGASSKLQAAQLAVEADIEVYIAHASRAESIEQALSGHSGTKIVK